jgi:biopolymer transport protein ExbB
MDSLAAFWAESDAIGRTVVVLLLLMSVSAWVLIFWKGWVLQRARRDIARAVPAFWSAGTLEAGQARLAALDREQVLAPLLAAARTPDGAGTLATRASTASQLTRRLRDALQRGLAHLQIGQVLLASIGSTAPFIGLFGTVWASTTRCSASRRPARSASTRWPARWARR